MKPLTVALTFLTVCAAAPPAAAQVSPANMVSGCDSINASPSCPGASYVTRTVYTVPAGQQFVLTDFVGEQNTTSYQILDNQSRRWIVALEKSWQTGLVFPAGHTVGVRINCSSVRTFFNWSGYLVPIGTGAVSSDATHQLGFSVSPNPSRQVVTLRFELTRPADIKLGIYDVAGRQVATLTGRRLSAGVYTKTWDGRTSAGVTAPPGVYLARIESSEATSVRRLVRVQ